MQIIVTLLIVLWVALSGAQALEPSEGRVLGVNDCKYCHDGKDARRLDPPLCRLNEAQEWSQWDRHALAYTCLDTDKGQAIVKNLRVRRGLEAGSQNDPVALLEEGCLDCHTIVKREQGESRMLRDSEKSASFSERDGVSCEACHGASERWSLPHREITWRAKSIEEKLALGMRDIRHPVVKARTCVSCHVGDPSQGRLVTHEMYSAGHPPLQGFEMVSYCENLPRHWDDPATKIPFRRARELRIGAVAALQAQARILLASARQAELQAESLPELAAYDCYACHHALRPSSARQNLEYVGELLGRPRVATWYLSVLAGDDASVPNQKSLRQELDAALAIQPFGKPDLLTKATAQIDEFCETQLNAWLAEPVNAGVLSQVELAARRSEAREQLERLCRDALPAAVDFDGTRNLAWAAIALFDDLSEGQQRPADVEKCLHDLQSRLALYPRRGATSHEVIMNQEALERRADFDLPADAESGASDRRELTMQDLLRLLPFIDRGDSNAAP